MRNYFVFLGLTLLCLCSPGTLLASEKVPVEQLLPAED